VGKFVERRLPIEAQYAPVYAMMGADLNMDGHLDLILTAITNIIEIYLGRYDANHGIALLGNGKGDFKYIPQLNQD